MKIHILHMNDVHSQLENHMRAGHELRNLRTALMTSGESVLTFDIGDVLDRVRPETEASMGRLNAALLGALGVDGWVFGNNEGLTIPVSMWDELAESSGASVFGTNIRDEFGNQLGSFTDLKIYTMEDVRVGVFGITPAYPKPYEHLGVRILDPVREAARAVQALCQSGADIVVALSHLGLRADHLLAQNVPGIHLILGGHTHQFMDEPVYEEQTAIFQVGKHGAAFGHTTLTVDDATRHLLRVSGRAIRIHPETPADLKMSAVSQAFYPVIQKSLDEHVCTLFEPLQTSLDSESSFANFLAEMIMREYSADLGLVVSGLLSASLLTGRVQRRHLHAACPTPTRPILLRISGHVLKDVLIQGLEDETRLARGFGFGWRGSRIGYLGLANVYIEAQREPGGRVMLTQARVSDAPLDEDRMYRMATVEYLWLSSVFPGIHSATEADIPAPLLRDLLIERISEEELVRDARQKHISMQQIPCAHRQ